MSCPNCGAAVTPGPGAWSRCPSCLAMVFAATPGPEVVIGHESERVVQQIGIVLAAAGMMPVHAKETARLVDLAKARQAKGAVLDVALDGALAFQLIDKLRNTAELARTKVVLIASVFNKTAYKRRPSSLYGADDYVEQHHIPDHLPQRLCALLKLPPPVLIRRETGSIAREAEFQSLGGEERLRALAHSIVADIALYYQGDMQHAARGEASPGLEGALDEGRRLLAEMIDARSYAGRDPILDAFRALLAELRGVVA